MRMILSALRKKNGVKSYRTIQYERELKSPDINTKNWELHQRRLNKFGESKYQDTYFYVGPKGGVYYITYRGTKVYC